MTLLLPAAVRRERGIGTVALLAAVLVTLGSGCHFGQLRGPSTPRLDQRDQNWTVVPAVPMVRQQARADCGVAALQMVVGHWQAGITEEQIRGWLGAIDEKKGVPAGQLREVLRTHGFQAFLVEGSWSDLEREVKQGHPVVVGILRIVGREGFPHYEVVVGTDTRDRQILTADPAEGWKKTAFDDFDRRWQASRRLALVVFPAPPATPAVPGS